MTRPKATQKAPNEPKERSSYVDGLREMYVDGSLDKAFDQQLKDVPDLLLSELFPRLFPMCH
jgi:hypothetical protein